MMVRVVSLSTMDVITHRLSALMDEEYSEFI
jgi:hypothetical protein